MGKFKCVSCGHRWEQAMTEIDPDMGPTCEKCFSYGVITGVSSTEVDDAETD